MASTRVAAIVLAAGESRRMGCCKQLLPVGGELAVIRVVKTIREAGVEHIVVVTGSNGDQVEAALAGEPVALARNMAVGSDMAQSVRIGLEQVPAEATGVFVCLADIPLVSPGTYRLMVQEHHRLPGSILSPVFDGRKGHPNLFPLPLLLEISWLPTLRDIVHAHPGAVHLLPVADRGVLEDMDTPDDYRRLVIQAHRSF